MHSTRVPLLLFVLASIVSSAALLPKRLSPAALEAQKLGRRFEIPTPSPALVDVRKRHDGHWGTASMPIQEADGLPCVNITIGTPPSGSVLLALDTGSPLTWTASAKYTPSLSATAQRTADKFNETYVSGNNAIGDVYKDTFHLGGLDAPDQRFGYATSRNDNDSRWEGLIGLDLPVSLDDSDGCTNCTLMTHLMDIGVIREDLFAVDAASDTPAFYLGSNPAVEADQTTQYFDLPAEFYDWRVPSVSINDVNTSSMSLDTGSAVIVTGKENLDKICSSVNGFIWAEESDLFTCNVTGAQRPLSLKLGNLSISLKPETVYVHTTLLVYALAGSDHLGILGLPFFKNAIVGFYGSQTSQPRIGITTLPTH